MIRYSPRAARALALLKRSYNDVDIFVEDTGNHNMWLLIIRRLLPQGVNVASVNLLGGKDAIIAACKLDQANSGRRKLYIIDGDFDFLLGKPRPRLRYLYRIAAYSIENLLITEDALVQIALESDPKKTEVQVATALDYNQIAAQMDATFRPLFVVYAAAHDLARRLQTVGYPVQNLFDAHPSGPSISKSKTASRILNLYRDVVAVAGLPQVRRRRKQIQARLATKEVGRFVAGKDYVLPFLLARFKARCGYRGSPEQFKVALARSFDPAADVYLTRRVKNICA